MPGSIASSGADAPGAGASRVQPTPGQGTVADVVHRNIRAQHEERRQRDAEAGRVHAVLRWVVRGMSSLWFLALNALVFTCWILVNTGVMPVVHRFDPFPFPLLSTITCLESIWLTTCVLINQRYASELQERRSDLALQVNLLAEHEITRMLTLLEAIRVRTGAEVSGLSDLPQLTRDTEPQAVMEEIERQTRQSRHPPPAPQGL